MNDLYKALGDISSIRKQMADTAEFRGYGPATLAATGLLAIAAAGIQALWLPDPQRQINAYLCLWILTAALCALLTGVQMYARSRRIHTGLSNEMLGMAVQQFLPSIAAGLLMTIVLLRSASDAAWMLPGLWQIVFSLGIFSSCRFLPPAMFVAGGWYLLTGLSCLAMADARALSPWTMGIAYGGGQLLVAAILLLNNRTEDEHEG